MGKSIENGVIKQLSPSMINAFDASTTFGCERRAWYKYVKGLEEPQKGNQALGEALHALIEERLKTGVDPQVEHEAVGLYLAGKHIIEDVAKRKVLGVEKPIEGFTLDGIRTVGYIDCVTEDGIIDWKTSSDIKRYGKTAEELAEDTQMVLYAKAMHPTRPTVKLAHGQFQTKGSKRARFVEVEVTQEHLDTHVDKVILPLVRRMKEVATVEDINKLPRNDKACFNCHFASHCPSSEGNTVMSFFKKVNAQSVTAAVTNSDKPVEVVKVETAAPILPPDAPASDPKIAAAPVEGFDPLPPVKSMSLAEFASTAEPVVMTPSQMTEATEKLEQVKEEKKRGRGRPPGSKNKAKIVDNGGAVISKPDYPSGTLGAEYKDLCEAGFSGTFEDFFLYKKFGPDFDKAQHGTSERHDAGFHPVPEMGEYRMTVKRIHVRKRFSINLGAFNNIGFEAEFEADVEGDADAAYEALKGMVEEKLNAEASKYEAEVGQKNKTMKPATEVIK